MLSTSAGSGDYHALTLVAPGIAEQARPGHFVALAVGGPSSPRCCCAGPSRSTGSRSAASTAARSRSSSRRTGEGTAWLAGSRRARPGRRRRAARPAVRAAQGAGDLRRWSAAATARRRCSRSAEQLRARGCRVDFVLGAATEERLFGALEAKRIVAVGRHHHRGRLAGRARSGHRRAARAAAAQRRPTSSTPAARWAMLQAVAEIARAYGAHSQCAVEESMACGIGVCMTCVLPVVGDDGVTRMAALLRRRSGVRRRPRPLGRRRHRPGRRRRARRSAGGRR